MVHRLTVPLSLSLATILGPGEAMSQVPLQLEERQISELGAHGVPPQRRASV